MVRYTAAPQAQRPIWWRILLSGLLVALGVVALVGSVATRYVNDNLLDTQRYVEIVGPLPQDPKVAAALGTFTADRLFNGLHVEDEIADFLPPKLAPLAPALTTSLQERVQGIAENVVMSNKFDAVWTGANQRMHEELLVLAHSEPVATAHPKVANAVLKLGGLLSSVRERFGSDQGILSDSQKDSLADVRVDLQQSVDQLRKTVHAIEFAAKAFPLAAVILLGGAIFAASNRRKAVLAIGITLMGLGASMLLAIALAWRHILSSFEQPVYRDAANVIYQAFYGNLQARLIGVTIVGLILGISAVLCGPYSWAVHLREYAHLTPQKHRVHRRHN